MNTWALPFGNTQSRERAREACSENSRTRANAWVDYEASQIRSSSLHSAKA